MRIGITGNPEYHNKRKIKDFIFNLKNKKLTKNDKIIAAYKEIEQEIRNSIQKIKTGNELEKKTAMDFLKSNQDTIKAYNNLKKV